MAKIELKKSSGLPLLLDNNELSALEGKYERKRTYSIDDVRHQLLNEELSFPQIFYTKYFKIDHEDLLTSKDLKVNCIVVPSNLAGIEYVKTKANYSDKHRILEVWYGSGTILLQKVMRKDQVYIARVKRDQKLIVPKDFAITIINTRQSVLVMGEVMADEGKVIPILDEMSGMAYYIIRKNAKQEIVRNPLYKMVNDFKRVNWDESLHNYNITLKTPIIKQIIRKHEKFDWLFEDNDIKIT